LRRLRRWWCDWLSVSRTVFTAETLRAATGA
jgi:hypothetical protein